MRHQVRDVGADAGESELLGDSGDDRNRAIGGHGERSVDRVAAGDFDHAFEVLEVDHLADVREREARGVGVAVDGDDAEAELLRPRDRPPLMAAGADEEDGLALHADDSRRRRRPRSRASR